MAHSEKTKAAAVAMMLTGSGVRETAAALHLPLSTVSRWHMEEVKPMQREIGKTWGLQGFRIKLRGFDFRSKRDTLSQFTSQRGSQE